MSDPLALPDGLGDAGRASLGAEAYVELQQQLVRHDNMQLINGAIDEDNVPGLNEETTYAERRATIESAMTRMIEAHTDISDQFALAVERIRARFETQVA